MRKPLFLLLAFYAFAIDASAQSPGRVCIPFDSTFHYLRSGNLNFWVQAGLLTTGQSRDLKLHNTMAFNLHYVPVKYLQTGFSLNKRLPVPHGMSFWKSYELAAFARYSFIRMACPKMAIYAHAGYTNVVQVRKDNDAKQNTWMPYGGIGLYKDLGKGFMLQLENELYFRQRPNQASLNLVWKFMDMKF